MVTDCSPDLLIPCAIPVFGRLPADAQTLLAAACMEGDEFAAGQQRT